MDKEKARQAEKERARRAAESVELLGYKKGERKN